MSNTTNQESNDKATTMEKNKDIAGLNTPTEKEIEQTIQEGSAKQRAALYLRHTTTRYLFWQPILNTHQEKALATLIENQEGDAYRHYLALYRKNLLFDRSLSVVLSTYFKAKWLIARLKGMLIALNQITAAEEIANTLIAPLSKEEREKRLRLAARGSDFYCSSIRTDEEGFMLIDTSKHWHDEIELLEEKTPALDDKIKNTQADAQFAVTSFYSHLEGFKEFANKVKFPLRDIYLKHIEKYGQDISKDTLPGFKYSISSAKAREQRARGREPYLEKKREKLLKEVDYLSFDCTPNKEQQERAYKLFVLAWEGLTGRKF